MVLLLCKQDEDLYMLELHMNSSTQKRGKDDEKHVYKVASFRPFSSSFKMISGLSLNEAECEELQEDLKKSLVEMKEEGEEENSDSVEDGPQRDRKVDEEEEGTPKRRKKSSKSVRLVHSAKSDRPESAASRVSTGTFLSIVEDGYSSNSDNRSRVSSSEDFFDDFEAPSDSYYRCAPTSAQTVKEIHRYADFDVDDIIGKCGNRPATAICIMRVMTRADSLTFQSTSSSPPTHRRAKSRAYSAAKSVGGDSQIEIITEDLPKQGSLLQRNSSVDLEAHLEETGRDTVPGLQIPQHENLCCNTFLTSTDKLVGVVALSARDNPQPPPPHHQFSSLQPTSKRFIKSSTSSSSSSSSSVATSTSFQDQISISVDSRFESSFDLSELASSISNTKPSKKIVDSLALNRNVDSVFPKLEPSNYIDENSTGTLVHFESVFPKQILDITSKSGKPITPISAIITSRKNTPSKRSVKSRKSSPPSSGSGGGNGKAGNNILNPKKIFKAPIVNVPDQGNCTCCKKKLGPTTIYKCRCGQIFCGKHRFEDKHNCSFDYKAAAKAGLVRENPKVSHDKITKL